MTPRTTLAILCASLLTCSLASAAPKSGYKAPSTLTFPEQLCQAYGTFAYNRAMDRDNGYSRLHVTAQSRAYDRKGNVGAQVEAIHDDLIRRVYLFPDLTPATIRQFAENECLADVEKAQATPPTQPKSDAKLRY